MSAQAGTGTRPTRGWLPFGLIALVVIPGAVFTIGIGEAVFGDREPTNTLMQGCGGVINLAIAERAIRRAVHCPAPARPEAALS